MSFRRSQRGGSLEAPQSPLSPRPVTAPPPQTENSRNSGGTHDGTLRGGGGGGGGGVVMPPADNIRRIRRGSSVLGPSTVKMDDISSSSRSSIRGSILGLADLAASTSVRTTSLASLQASGASTRSLERQRSRSFHESPREIRDDRMITAAAAASTTTTTSGEAAAGSSATSPELKRWSTSRHSGIRLRMFARLVQATQRVFFVGSLYALICLSIVTPIAMFLRFVALPVAEGHDDDEHGDEDEDDEHGDDDDDGWWLRENLSIILTINLALSVASGARSLALLLLGLGGVKDHALVLALGLDVAVWICACATWVQAWDVGDDWTERHKYLLSIAGLLHAVQLNTGMILNGILDPLVKTKDGFRHKESVSLSVVELVVDQEIRSSTTPSPRHPRYLLDEEQRMILKEELRAADYDAQGHLDPVKFFDFSNRAAFWIERWSRELESDDDKYDEDGDDGDGGADEGGVTGQRSTLRELQKQLQFTHLLLVQELEQIRSEQRDREKAGGGGGESTAIAEGRERERQVETIEEEETEENSDGQPDGAPRHLDKKASVQTEESSSLRFDVSSQGSQKFDGSGEGQHRVGKSNNEALGEDQDEDESVEDGEESESNRSAVRALLLSIEHLVEGQKMRAFSMVVFLCVMAITQYSGYWVVGDAVNIANAVADGDESLRDRFNTYIVVLTTIVVTNIIAYYITASIGSHLIANASARIQREISKKVLYGGVEFENAYTPAELTNGFNASLAKSEAVWTELWYGLVFPCACLISAVTFLCLVDVGYAMFTLVAIPTIVCCKNIISPHATEASAIFTAASARLLGRFQNVVAIRKAAKVYENQDYLKDRLEERILDTRTANYNSLLWGNVFGAVFNSVGSILLIVTVIVLLLALSTGKISAGELLSLMNFVNGVIKPLEALGLLSGRLTYMSGAVFAIDKLLKHEAEECGGDHLKNEEEQKEQSADPFDDSKPYYDDVGSPEVAITHRAEDQKRRGEPKELTLDDGLQFENVCFRYSAEPDSRLVLNNISATIPTGSYVCIFGPSGCGKSTLLSLVEGIHKCTSGRICMDGVDIKSVPLSKLRRQLGVVFQDIFVLDGTIYENIAFGYDDRTSSSTLTTTHGEENGDDKKLISREAVIQAAKDAQIHSFIETLPNRYDTAIGLEAEISLSGGQLQRICGLARALARNPTLLVLDEATSALDSIAETFVIDTIVGLRERKEKGKRMTTLSVSHHTSTAMQADKILVLDRTGCIDQAGTYEELVDPKQSGSGLFADLVAAEHGRYYEE